MFQLYHVMVILQGEANDLFPDDQFVRAGSIEAAIVEGVRIMTRDGDRLVSVRVRLADNPSHWNAYAKER